MRKYLGSMGRHEQKERDARSRRGIHGLESSAVLSQWKTWGAITKNQGDYLRMKQMEEERTRLLDNSENLWNHSFGLWAEVTSRIKDILLHWQNLGIMGHGIAQMRMPYRIRTQHTFSSYTCEMRAEMTVTPVKISSDPPSPASLDTSLETSPQFFLGGSVFILCWLWGH